jgi:hypothetical protein
VDEPSRLGNRWSRLAAWLLVLSVFGVAVGAWGATLGGLVSVRALSAVATPAPNFGARQVFVSSPENNATLDLTTNCVYGQSGQGTLIVMSAKTGSLLSEAQAANCTK